MSGPGIANVQSLDAVRDVRVSLISFGEQITGALDELRSKIDRTMAWLEQDRPLYWRDQERRAYDRVATTRVAYEICRMKTIGGRHPECIEERVAHQRAKERLEYCKNKVEVVRRWCIEAGRQVDEYRGRCSPLKGMLSDDVPKTVAMLGRIIEALEAYADIQNAQASVQSASLGSETSPEADGDKKGLDETNVAVTAADTASDDETGHVPRDAHNESSLD